MNTMWGFTSILNPLTDKFVVRTSLKLISPASPEVNYVTTKIFNSAFFVWMYHGQHISYIGVVGHLSSSAPKRPVSGKSEVWKKVYFQ